jgi:hypothetical protein
MKSNFPTSRTLVALILGWAAACYGADLALHPRPLSQLFNAASFSGPSATDKPHVAIWMNHLCCSGCLSDVNAALQKLPWVGATSVRAVASHDEADARAQAGRASFELARNVVEFDVRREDIGLVDFVALDHALRSIGLTADRIDFTGVQHYRLRAQLNHVCCGMCASALDSGLGVARQLRATGQFGWIDSVSTSKTQKTLTIHARYGATAEIEELMAAINKLGFEPQSLVAAVDSEI